MKVLYIGNLVVGSTSLMRLNAFRYNNHSVVGIDTTLPGKRTLRGIIARIGMKINVHVDINGINNLVLDILGRDSFNLVLIDKHLVIKPSTIYFIKSLGVPVDGYFGDDIENQSNCSSNFTKSAYLYRRVFTTKSYNLNFYSKFGVDVIFINNMYSRNSHFVSVGNRKKYDISFIGAYEQDRCNSITSLVECGFEVTWFCHENSRFIPRLKGLNVVVGYIESNVYSRIVSETKINLNFLRKVNRDLQTTRSIEIPAMGGCMLTEYSSEHDNLFQENLEAVFFTDNADLVLKAKNILELKTWSSIGENGRRAVINHGLSYENWVKKYF